MLKLVTMIVMMANVKMIVNVLQAHVAMVVTIKMMIMPVIATDKSSIAVLGAAAVELM